jgi:uncharacterized protein with GYD domain
VVFYGVVDSDGESVIEFFATRGEAEAFIAEVESDEPEMAATFRIEAVEFEQGLK